MESATVREIVTAPPVPNRCDSAQLHDDTQIVHLNVSWDAYNGLVAALGDHNHVRLAYDGETLEIMSPGFTHEQITRLIGLILPYTFDEWEIDYEDSGATTFKTGVYGGFEGDASFYIANADKIRGMNNIDLAVDPAPDLILEVDITNRRMDKKAIYEQLGVSEFWRFDQKAGLQAFALEDGAYTKVDVSRVVVGLPLAAINAFIERLKAGDRRPAIIAAVKQWLRANRHLHGETGSAKGLG